MQRSLQNNVISEVFAFGFQGTNLSHGALYFCDTQQILKNLRGAMAMFKARDQIPWPLNAALLVERNFFSLC